MDELFETEPVAKERRRDLSFETLAEVTNAGIDRERGALNAALKSIREEEPDLEDEELALVIRYRADDYRRLWPEQALTPTALSKHWLRVRAELERSKTPPSPVDQPIEICPTCHGDRVVETGTRPSKNPQSPYVECAPCPDCNPQTVTWWQFDGRRRSTPDPGQVRRMMSP